MRGSRLSFSEWRAIMRVREGPLAVTFRRTLLVSRAGEITRRTRQRRPYEGGGPASSDPVLTARDRENGLRLAPCSTGGCDWSMRPPGKRGVKRVSTNGFVDMRQPKGVLPRVMRPSGKGV